MAKPDTEITFSQLKEGSIIQIENEANVEMQLKRYAEFLSELEAIREKFIKSVSEARVNDAVAFLQAVNVRNQAVKSARGKFRPQDAQSARWRMTIPDKPKVAERQIQLTFDRRSDNLRVGE